MGKQTGTSAVRSAFRGDKTKSVGKSIRNKNISKREFDSARKVKKAARVEKVKERKV
jgi:hypothetical protein